MSGGVTSLSSAGPRPRHVPWLRWIIALVAVTGCAAKVGVESLSADGYRKSQLSRPETDYELWWKETRAAQRVVHFCIVPKVTGQSYRWIITALVDEKPVWSYSSREF